MARQRIGALMVIDDMLEQGGKRLMMLQGKDERNQIDRRILLQRRQQRRVELRFIPNQMR